MRVARAAGAPVLFVLLALVGHWPALAMLTTATQCSCEDLPQTDWFLVWTPWALAHGQNPFFSDHLLVPDGVNLAWNTLLPLPALLAWPVTAWLGPFAAHTLLAVVAFAGSALTMRWAVSRWVVDERARSAAGLLYGFSPYLVAQGTGHLNLSLVLLPPVVLRLLDDLLVRGRTRAGLWLGLVTLAQLLVTEEVLASTFVMCVLGAVVLLLQARPRVRVALSRLPGLLLAAVVLAAGAAWPLATQFGGEQRVTEPVQDVTQAAGDLLGLVVPTVHQWWGSDVALGWGANPSENGSYLGVPLLLALAALTWRVRRHRVARFALAMAVVAWLLSLGERVRVAGEVTDVPLPFALVHELPVLENLVPVRFSLYVVLFAALLLALGLDGLRVPRLRGRVVSGVLVAAVVLPLVPAWPYAHEATDTPAYFSSPSVERVAEGSVAVTYPVPRFPSTSPMAWQAVAGMRYRSVGGYVISPDARGRGTFVGGEITRLEKVFVAAQNGADLPDRPSPSLVSLLQLELRGLQAGSVLVGDHVAGAAEVVALLTAVLERPPDEVSGGVTAWYALPSGLVTR